MKNKIGKILELFISVSGISQRVTKKEIKVDENGVFGDKFYGKDVERSVLMTSKYSYDLATKNDISIKNSDLGENILIDYNLYNLPLNSKLEIGEVILEISQNCTLCKSLVKVDRKLPKLLKNDRGVFARIIKNGIIKKNDEIFLIT